MSSAYDLSRLISFAAARRAHRADHADRRATRSRPAAAPFSIHSTNRLVRGGEVDVMGGKTGFISKAGYCLATLLRLPQGNHKVAVVVLGASSNNGRFWETRHLFNWLSRKASDVFAKERQQLTAVPARQLFVAPLHRRRVERQRRDSHRRPADRTRALAARRTP